MAHTEDPNKASNYIEPSNIVIPLRGFNYNSNSLDQDCTANHLFVGRKILLDKLTNLLLEKNNKRGSYLIAGYRGSGKSKLISKVIQESKHKARKPDLIEIRINLGDNSQLTSLNIFYSMASILFDNLSDESHRKKSTNSSKNSFQVFFRKFLSPVIDFKNILLYAGILLFCAIPLLAIHPEIFVDALNIPFITCTVISLPFITLLVWLFIKSPLRDSLNQIQILIDRMSYEISENHHTGLEDKIINFGFSKHKKTLPINSREAEELLIKILRGLQPRYKVVFILDEIDKLSDDEELNHHDKPHTQESSKNEKINTLLGSLKNFISSAPAIFFFISGRETLDRYYSEKGSPNSLYGSLFDQVFEVPSFLTDKGNRPRRNTQLYASIEEYVCRCILLPKYAEEIHPNYYTLQSLNSSQIIQGGASKSEENQEFRYRISILMNFILYLTFHSWGNPKKLYSIFESFVYPLESFEKENLLSRIRKYLNLGSSKNTEKPRYCLVFGTNHLRSFSLASEITTLFQHQLSREVSQISDKLAVSSFSSLHFILKLHSYGFKRETLHLMS